MTAHVDRGQTLAVPDRARQGETPLWGPFDAALRPLDALRRWSWQLSAKTAFGRACLRDRPLRLTTLAFTHMAVAAILTLIAPVWLLLLGPIVLGVPHVASDVRYLLINPPLPLGRRGLVLLLGPLMMMTLLRIVPAFGGPYLPEAEVLLGGAAMLGGVAIAPASAAKRAIGAAAVVALISFALTAPYESLLVIAHVHNLVAFALWLWLFRSETSKGAIFGIAVVYLGFAALFMSGACDGLLIGHAMDGDIGRFGMLEMTDTLAPGWEIEPALRLVAVFAFAQAMHYVVWLRLIPQRLDARTAPPTIRRSVQRVRFDFGRAGFVLLIGATLVVPLAAIAFDASQVRNLYLLAAIAHGWIELAIIAALLTRSRRGASV